MRWLLCLYMEDFDLIICSNYKVNCIKCYRNKTFNFILII